MKLPNVVNLKHLTLQWSRIVRIYFLWICFSSGVSGSLWIPCEMESICNVFLRLSDWRVSGDASCLSKVWICCSARSKWEMVIWENGVNILQNEQNDVSSSLQCLVSGKLWTILNCPRPKPFVRFHHKLPINWVHWTKNDN